LLIWMSVCRKIVLDNMPVKKSRKIYDVFLFISVVVLLIAFLINLPITYYEFINQNFQKIGIAHVISGILFFVDLALIIMINILFFRLYGAIKHLGVKENIINKISLALSMFSKGAAEIFNDKAARDKRGTYLSSFDKFKKYDTLSKQAFYRTVFLLLLQVFILGFLLFSLVSINSSGSDTSKAQQASHFKLQQINKFE
jgi:hypothetical protein